MSRALLLALVTFVSAAPPLVPEETIKFDITPYIPLIPEEIYGEELVGAGDCVDGVHNVIKLADTKGSLDIQLKDVEARTYDMSGKPSCAYGRAWVALPGIIKAVKGHVVVNKPFDLKKQQASVKLTVQKNSWFVGVVCKDGKANSKYVTDDICTQPVKLPKGDFPAKIVEMLKTPGTYDVAEIAKVAGVPLKFELPPVSGTVRLAAKGDWKVSARVVSGNRDVAAIKVPSNTEWLYLY